VDKVRESPGFPPPGEPERVRFYWAIEQHRRGAFQDAEVAYARFLLERPDDPAALRHLAALYAQTGRATRAVELISKATGLESHAAATYMELARALIRVGASAAALDTLDQLIALHPDVAEAHRVRGAMLRRLRRLAEALASYDRATALEPRSAEAHVGRAAVLLDMKLPDEALASCDAALASTPDSATAHSTRAAALLSLVRHTEALASLDRATELEPGLWDAHVNRGSALRALRRFEAAVASYERAIEIRPDDAAAHAGRAASLLGQQRLEEALASYARAASLQPTNVAYRAACGEIQLELGRIQDALASCDEALRLQPGLEGASVTRAAALRRLGRADLALAGLDAALAIAPGSARLHEARAAALTDLRRLDEALATCERAIALHPGFASLHASRGAVLNALERAGAALESFDEALRRGADTQPVHSGRALACLSLGRFPEAIASCDRVIELGFEREIGRGAPGAGTDPREAAVVAVAAAYTHRGVALWSLGHAAQALESYDHAIALRPEVASTHGWRGAALVALKRPDAALASFDAALRYGEDTPPVHAGRAAALVALDRMQDAIASCERAIELGTRGGAAQEPGGDGAGPSSAAPAVASAYTYRGIAQQSLGLFTDALASFERAMRLGPDLQGAFVNAATCNLALGRFEAGWALFERRSKFDEAERPWAFAGPQWQGEPLDGKVLYVYYEQGLGDTIQFCRYATLAAARGAHVVLAVQDRLWRLVRSLGRAVEVVAASATPPTFDYHSPLLSLPGVFGTHFGNVPCDGGYLGAEPDRVLRWRDRIGAQGFRIGINWQGSHRPIDRGRSFPLSLFAPLAAVPGVRLLSLQKGPACAQLNALPQGMVVEELGEDFDEGTDAFLDTAAVMDNLDLVITSDTSVAHLAGALGRPTWVALRHVPEWRWFQGRDDSPWYRGHRLFRQSSPGDWSGVFERMHRELLRHLQGT
jgi:tetratricopeptide (TPR) repeat protein